MTNVEPFWRMIENLKDFESHISEDTTQASVHSLDAHKEELKALWAEVRTAYDKCSAELASNITGLEPIRKQYRDAYKIYLKCISKIGQEMQNLSFAPSHASSPQSAGTRIPSSGFQLPPCDIEAFSGDYLKWPSFRDMFQSVYINNTDISSVQKLYFLRTKTKGEPHEIVSKPLLSNEAFEVAWKNLKARYENKRVLINSQLKVLLHLQAIKSECSESIKALQRDLNACRSALELYQIEVAQWDAIFVYIGSSKLPDVTLALWEQSLEEKSEIPTFTQLDDFLTNRFRSLESVADIRPTSSRNHNAQLPSRNPRANSRSNLRAFPTNVSLAQCKLCSNASHPIKNCPTFLSKGVDERTSIIKKSRLCLNCFGPSHELRNCTSRFNCFKCKRRHHTLLHRDDAFTPTSTNPNANPTSSQTIPHRETISNLSQTPTSSRPTDQRHLQAYHASNESKVLLGTAIVTIQSNGVWYPARALIDSGSEGSFISERIFKLIRPPYRNVNVQISGLNHSVSASTRKSCDLILGSPLDSTLTIPINVLVLPNIVGNLPSSSINPEIVSKLPPLQYADPNFYNSSHVDVLLGGDVIPKVMLSGVLNQIESSLLAQETIFGWIMTGPIPKSMFAGKCCIKYSDTPALDQAIMKFWELEEVPRTPLLSSEEQYCETLYKETTNRAADGRYIVQLPFRPNLTQLPTLDSSRRAALPLYLSNERRLGRDPFFKEEYTKVVQEYETLGHMTKTSLPKDPESQGFYLPHHAVIKLESCSTKTRVVFNASYRGHSGISLNDTLLPGPILQADLTLILLRWRMFRYVFNSDIQQMYRQILVIPQHTPFQRILFRTQPSEEISDYELQTVTFGVNCAPFLAIRTLLQLAEDVQQDLPIASEILRNHMYVDDILAGAHDEISAIQARDQVVQALNSACFPLRKWTSNSKKVLEDLPVEHLRQRNFLSFEDESSAKTLGIRWNAFNDAFYFVTNPTELKTSYTKREVLSSIAKLFDPAGWLSPCVILAKILMQEIWLHKVDWDDPIPKGCLAKWQNFLTNQAYINEIKIPRWVNYNPNHSIQIHGFCDASEKAYAATIYIRVQNGISVHTHLLVAKTKVAPVKTVSLPRLELCAAVLLATLMDAYLPQLNIQFDESYQWSDSMIVLAWLRQPPCKWGIFVSHRVAKISQLVGVNNWYHVESKKNPADIASRGAPPEELIDNSLWWNGPSWLAQPKSQWPKLSVDDIPETTEEMKTLKSCTTVMQKFQDPFEKFSSFSKAVRVYAYVFRFVKRFIPHFPVPCDYSSTFITPEEFQGTMTRIIVAYQQALFPNEYQSLSRGESVRSTSSILNTNPFLDSEGVMRVGGRLAFTPTMSHDERHPIILPYTCQFTRLYVQMIHDVTIHGGNQLMLRMIRLKYWIPRVKNLIKTTIHKCKRCVIYKRHINTQLMASLPKDRVSISRPFDVVGVDFAGPVEIKTSTLRSAKVLKGYVCVWVCFSTKAIHLESLSSLSSDCFMATFNRFCSRRGCPSHIYSDNGTTFVAASKRISQDFLKATSEQVMSEFRHQNLKWHFIPPGAPHMGGLWEAGVKSFKEHFRKISMGIKYTFEEFTTILCRIEACLNSRPLTALSENPDDFTALTPGHFLAGTPILAPAEPAMSTSSPNIIKRWQKVTAFYQAFCTRWKTEYLHDLQKRNKWKHPEKDLRQGDLVVIREDNLPPNEWRLGRILSVNPGSDQRVRVAQIKTYRGVVTRPIVKLVLLPCEK